MLSFSFPSINFWPIISFFKNSSLKDAYRQIFNKQRKQIMYQSPYTHHIAQIFQLFDTNKTNRLNVTELMNYYNSFNRKNAIPIIFTQDLVDKCLKKIDWNHDNGINQQEYEAFLNRNFNGRPINPLFYPNLRDIANDNDLKRQIDDIFKQFDWDQSFQLTPDQLAAFYNSLYRNNGILIQLTPYNANQVLSLFNKNSLGKQDLFTFIRQFKQTPKQITLSS